MKWQRLCCQPHRSRPAPSAWPRPYLSQMLRSKGLRCILFFPCCLASRAVTISDSSQSSDFLLGRSLLFSSVCHPTPHLFPSLCLPVGSILSPLPLPSLCFSPSFLVWPIAPFRFAQGKECRVCIAWQYARSHHFLPIPSFAFYAILPSYLSLLSLIPCFLPLSYLCLNSSSPPRSLHLSPSTSLCPHHSFHLLLITNPPSLSLPAFIHTSLCVFLSSILPLLPPPSSFPRLGSGAVNRCCLLLIWVRSD